jgi:hypothetical protein
VSLKILRSVMFFVLLQRLDQDLAALARSEKCAICGGPLHSARYPRKLRGVPDEVAARFTRRESFCCAKEGCRKRTTPPSVVFFGRRSYLTAMVLLVSALADGASERRLARLSGLYGIDRRTLLCWRKWWEKSFPKSDFFAATAGRFAAPLGPRRLPGGILDLFGGRGVERLLSALLFLCPLSTLSVPFERASRWAAKTRRGGFMTTF